MQRIFSGLLLFSLVLGLACGGNDNDTGGSSPPSGGGNSASGGANTGGGAKPTECVSSDLASGSVGKRVMVCGPIADASYRADVSGRPTFLNFDRRFPNHTFTALVWGENRGKFSPPPEQQFGVGKQVCVTGLVENFQGKPQIIVTSPDQIKVC